MKRPRKDPKDIISEIEKIRYDIEEIEVNFY